MKKHRGLDYSSEDMEWLKKNYPIHGVKYCSEKLSRSRSSIEGKTFRMGISVNYNVILKLKSEGSNAAFIPRINVNDFIKIEKPEVAYILGLLWADGWIDNSTGHSIKIKLIKEDFDKIEFIFDRIGTWRKYYMNPKNRKPVTELCISGKPLVEYLISMDYKDKSFKAPYKILETIPEKFKHLFFRGYLDGDGFIGPLQRPGYILNFASGYEQDWGFLPKKFKITRRVTNKILNHRNSYASLANKQDCIEYLNYLYQNAENDKLYLPRKYERYLDYKDKAKINPYKNYSV